MGGRENLKCGISETLSDRLGEKLESVGLEGRLGLLTFSNDLCELIAINTEIGIFRKIFRNKEIDLCNSLPNCQFLEAEGRCQGNRRLTNTGDFYKKVADVCGQRRSDLCYDRSMPKGTTACDIVLVGAPPTAIAVQEVGLGSQEVGQGSQKIKNSKTQEVGQGAGVEDGTKGKEEEKEEERRKTVGKGEGRKT